MPDFKDTPEPPMKGADPADPVDPSVSSATPEADEEGHTVELVSFGPTFTIPEATPPNPEDIALLARRRFRRWAWALSILASVLFGMSFGPEIYRGTKSYLAASMARQAEDEVDKKQMDEAIASVRSGFKMAPSEPEVLRAMARIFSALDVPGGMAYWNWVLESNQATEDDRRQAADYATRQGLYGDAAGIIQSLLKKNGDDAKNLIMAAQLYSVTGDSAKAMAYATRATLNDPTYKPAAIFLAFEELNNSYLRQAGIDSLSKIADEDDSYGLVALQRLVTVPNLKPQETDHVIARLHAHPLAGESEKLSALALEIKKNPAQRKALLKDAVAAHQNVSIEILQQFVSWLNAMNEPASVLSLVSSEKALTDKGLFASYLDALIALKKWNDLKTILSQPKVPMDTAYVQLYLSRWAYGKGDAQAEDLYWRGAQAAAAHNPRQGLYLALYAEKMGRNDRADAIYRLLTQEPIVSRISFLGLLRVNGSKDTQTIQDILDQMVTQWPLDTTALDRDAYFNLLLNTRVQEMLQREITLAKNDPYSLYHRTNLALAYLRLKNSGEALKVYKDTNVQWDQVPVSAQIVYAATLAANGQNTQARHIAHLIDRESLRLEERALIKSIH